MKLYYPDNEIENSIDVTLDENDFKEIIKGVYAKYNANATEIKKNRFKELRLHKKINRDSIPE